MPRMFFGMDGYCTRLLAMCLAMLCLLSACGGGTTSVEKHENSEGGRLWPPNTEDAGTKASPPENSLTDIRPPDPALVEQLNAEFARLGIDPDKVPAKAPAGSGNGVFDLVVGISDPDGEGPLLPDGIELSWTERSIGDYDGNGIVNISDLTPLGQKLDTEVAYRAGEAVVYYPLGDPVADSANWLNARVDGDGNGLISQADITPIAQHWKEILSGYRVYRRGPGGGGGFELLPDPESPSSGYSIQRSAQPGQPVRYSYVDEPPLPGEYEY